MAKKIPGIKNAEKVLDTMLDILDNGAVTNNIVHAGTKAADPVAFAAKKAKYAANKGKLAESRITKQSLDSDWENLVAAQQKNAAQIEKSQYAAANQAKKEEILARRGGQSTDPYQLSEPDVTTTNEIFRNSIQEEARAAGMSTRDYYKFQKGQAAAINDNHEMLKSMDPTASMSDARELALGDFNSAKQTKLDARQAKKEAKRQAGVEAKEMNELKGMNFGDIDSPSAASVSSSSSPAKNVENVISGRASNILDHNRQRFTPKMQADIEKYSAMVKSGDTEGLKKMGAGMGVEGNLSESAIREHWGGRMAQVTTADKMSYHQVPQKLAAAGGTAYLVSSMSHSKGQMDNSQLYGQSSPYGM